MTHDDGRTYYDVDHAQRLRDAERRVIEEATVMAAMIDRQINEERPTVQLDEAIADQTERVCAAVRSLREVQGE